jgi:polyhydroxybutyrate depolymerase
MPRFARAATLGLVCLVVAVVCRPQVPSGAKERALRLGPVERTYVLYAGKTTKKSALVVVLHGMGTSGAVIEQRTNRTFDTLADREGLVVVYPNAMGEQWEDGWSDGPFERNDAMDDVMFLSALIDSLTAEYDIDPKRVYMTGFSNGAAMAYRFACEQANKVAAVAPVSGGMPRAVAERCRNGRPVPILVMHGTKDSIVPFVGAPHAITEWATRDGCHAAPDTTYLPDTDPNDGTRTRIQHFADCQDGSEVSFYAIEGGGHAWPGGEASVRQLLASGNTCRDFDAGLVIWDFFKKHALP